LFLCILLSVRSGNKIYLEENGKGVFLDFGKNFGKYGVFYEEFLKNRDTRCTFKLFKILFAPGGDNL
jgi:ribonuclease J